MSRIFKNIAALALMVGALIGSVGTSDAQNYRHYNNAYGSGPAYNGVYRSHRAMAPCLLSVAITQIRSIKTKVLAYHRRPSILRWVVIN